MNSRSPRSARTVLLALGACSALLLMSAAPAFAAGTTQSLRDAAAADLVAGIVGDHVQVQNVTATGDPVQIASYDGIDLGAGPEAGLALSSGSLVAADPASEDDLDFTASALLGPNTRLTTTGDFGGAGDSALTELVGTTTYDAAVLTLEVVPEGSPLTVTYRFGSEEYAGWAEREFTDALGIWVGGTLCSIVPGGEAAGVSTINANTHSDLYVPNFDGRTPGSIDTEMNGFSVPLTCTADVTPGEPVTVTFAVGDTVDGQLDSTLLLAAGSLTSPAGPTPTPSPTPTSTPTPTETATPTPSPTATAAPGRPAGNGGGPLANSGGDFDPTLPIVAGILLVGGAALVGVSAWRRRRARADGGTTT